MSWRRTVRACSLAFLVAVLAHGADFGSSHAPGGRQGEGLLHALWAALALLGFSALLSGALAPRKRPREAAAARSGTSAPLSFLVLTLGGFAAFCGMEALEGHVPSVEPALVLYLAAAAAAVTFGSRLAGTWLSELGGELAALAGSPVALCDRSIVRFRMSRAVFANRILVRGAHRGRAPPFVER
jgi:hypothetical protein